MSVEQKLKTLAKRLTKKISFQKLTAALCDKGLPSLFIYPVTTIPRSALEEITNTFQNEGLFPVFEEVKGGLLIKWIPHVEINKCEQLEGKQDSLIPIEVLREDNTQCINFYKDIFGRDKASVLLFVMPDCEACQELQKFIWEDQLGITDSLQADLLQEGINNLYEIRPAECPSYIRVFQIRVYPTGLLVIRGKVVDRCEGYDDCKKKLLQWLLKVSSYYSSRKLV